MAGVDAEELTRAMRERKTRTLKGEGCGTRSAGKKKEGRGRFVAQGKEASPCMGGMRNSGGGL
jgi:hypothetical protein